MSDGRLDGKASKAVLYVYLSISGVHTRRGWQQAPRVLCKATRQWRSKATDVFRSFDLVFIIQRTYLAAMAVTAIWTTLWGQKVFSYTVFRRPPCHSETQVESYPHWPGRKWEVRGTE